MGLEIAHGYMVQERLLRLVGTWPLDRYCFAKVSINRWVLAIMTQMSALCSLSLEIYRHCLGLDDAMDAFIMGLSCITSLSKLLILRLKWKHTYALMSSSMEDWSVVKDSHHRWVMSKYWHRGRIVSLMMLYLGYASGISFVLKALPLNALLPLEVKHSVLNDSTVGTISPDKAFEVDYFLPTYCVFGPVPLIQQVCILAWQAASIFVNAVAHCGNDGFFFSLTMHLCGQFEILKINLAELEIEKIGDLKKIGSLVKRHCHLVLLADNLEQSFNIVMLVQLLMSLLLICIQGFMGVVFLHKHDKYSALKSAIIVTTLLVQLYVYTYAGQTLESRTEEIAFATYDSSWYRFRGNTARDLTLIINRGNTPYRVTAGKFVSMNLLTFKEILKASGSYLSVLQVHKVMREHLNNQETSLLPNTEVTSWLTPITYELIVVSMYPGNIKKLLQYTKVTNYIRLLGICDTLIT